MAFRFNPFTGNLDLVGDSGGGGTPGGSDTNIQFNDNGSFGGSSDFTWNDATKSLSVGGNANLYGSLTAGGDVELNDGGLFTTTVQSVTPTANRFISFPDATGTVALVGGASGQVIWNNAGSLAGASTLTYDGSVLTTSGRFVNSYNATVASAPAKTFTGTWFTGGTPTTTKPHVLIEPAGTTSTNWSTSGTGLGINAPSGFLGDLAWFGVNGTASARIDSAGTITIAGGIAHGSSHYNIKNIDGAIGSNSVVSAATGFYIGSRLTANANTRLVADGNHIFAQRNGTNAQAFRIYNTFTSATNFERLNVRWAANEAIIDTEAGSGGGTLRGLKIGSASTSLLGFYGATPAVQPAAVANATDAATVITQLNALLSRLRTIGIIAT